MRPTPPQRSLNTLFAALKGARDELDPERFAAFIWIGCDKFGIEAARLVVAEATDVTREESAAA